MKPKNRYSVVVFLIGFFAGQGIAGEIIRVAPRGEASAGDFRRMRREINAEINLRCSHADHQRLELRKVISEQLENPGDACLLLEFKNQSPKVALPLPSPPVQKDMERDWCDSYEDCHVLEMLICTGGCVAGIAGVAWAGSPIYINCCLPSCGLCGLFGFVCYGCLCGAAGSGTGWCAFKILKSSADFLICCAGETSFACSYCCRSALNHYRIKKNHSNATKIVRAVDNEIKSLVKFYSSKATPREIQKLICEYLGEKKAAVEWKFKFPPPEKIHDQALAE